MANPQRENGHTMIANELLEAICRFDFTGAEMRILFFIIRKTYGYHKKMDKISISQFQQQCLLPRQTTIDCLNRLVRMSVLYKENTKNITKYGLQKDYDAWIVRTTVQYEMPHPTSTKCPENQYEPPYIQNKRTKEIYTKESKNKFLKDLEQFKNNFGGL